MKRFFNKFENVLDTFKVDTTDDLFLNVKESLLHLKYPSLFPERKIIQSNDNIVLLNDVKQKKILYTFERINTRYEFTLC